MDRLYSDTNVPRTRFSTWEIGKNNRFGRISSGRIIYYSAIYRWPIPKSYCFTPVLSWSQFVCARLSFCIVLSCRRSILTVMLRQPCTAYLAVDGPVIRIAAGCTSYVHGYFITSISYIPFLKPTDKRFLMNFKKNILKISFIPNQAYSFPIINWNN